MSSFIGFVKFTLRGIGPRALGLGRGIGQWALGLGHWALVILARVRLPSGLRHGITMPPDLIGFGSNYGPFCQQGAGAFPTA